ncbi:MAG TPA: UbiA family prenyltransferase [Spirochaetia bacterium]|nr:UbiA family prenyltransferase [Spirochaetia bacterium]
MGNSATLSREGVRKFFGLSRMTHSVLDIAHPAMGALLVFGGFPSPSIVVIGLLAAFAGFTAVFALNDVMDCSVDCEKMAKLTGKKECFDIDSVGYRHPIAQGVLTFNAALSWVAIWGLLALSLAFILRPLCAALMVGALVLEIGYCRLLRVSHWKTVLSGAMVAVGGLAGVYAVSAAPAAGFVALFFAWAFAWEVGCRNIPNDWSDLEEDIVMKVRTFPVRYGRKASSWVSFGLLCVTVAASLVFPLVVPVRHPLVYAAGALAAGVILLIAPAVRWVSDQKTTSAMYLFNRACFYPLAVCGIVGVLIIV